MTDPLATALGQIDAERKRLLGARDVVENAMRFRDQAARLGFKPEIIANHTGFGIWVPFHDELVDALAAGGVVPPWPEMVKEPVAAASAPMPNSDINDAGKPWPATRDDYQPPVEEAAPSEPPCAHKTTARVHGTGETECVSCSETVATPVLPPIKDHHRKPVQPVAKREGWTADDEADLLERIGRGETDAQIAVATNRKTKSVAGKITYMRSRGLLAVHAPEKPAATPRPAPAPVTAAPAKPVEPAAPSAPAPVTSVPSSDDPDDDADFWTPARKLALTECLLRGMKMIDAADEVGCSGDEAKAQWKTLYPGSGLDDQQKLLRRLRADIEKGVAA